MNCYVQFMSYEFIINAFFKDQTWVNKSKKKDRNDDFHSFGTLISVPIFPW